MANVFTPAFVDLFQRANENPLDPTHYTAMFGAFEVLSHACVAADPQNGANPGTAYYAGALSNDCYILAIVGHAGVTSSLGMNIRSDAEAAVGVSLDIVSDFNGTTTNEVITFSDNQDPFTAIGGSPDTFTLGLKTGDAIRLWVIGNVYGFDVNGITIYSGPLVRYTSGVTSFVGVANSGNTPSDFQISRIELGNVTAAVPGGSVLAGGKAFDLTNQPSIPYRGIIRPGIVLPPRSFWRN